MYTRFNLSDCISLALHVSKKRSAQAAMASCLLFGEAIATLCLFLPQICSSASLQLSVMQHDLCICSFISAVVSTSPQLTNMCHKLDMESLSPLCTAQARTSCCKRHLLHMCSGTGPGTGSGWAQQPGQHLLHEFQYPKFGSHRTSHA